jgi:hypothetical protein
MYEANPSGMTTAELFGATWRVWRSHAGTFVLLMGIPIAILLLSALIVNFVIAPHPENTLLREVWLGMDSLRKMAVFVVFLASFAMQYRALAASVFATQEFQAGRSVGIWQALVTVRRKQLRLFWLVMLASLLTGPFGLIVFPILSFAVAPGFPVAILETKPALAAIKRGDALAKGHYGRIALLVLLWLGFGVAAVFAWIRLLMMLQERFGQPFPWFLRPVPILGFWLILLIPQLYIIALTLNYLDQLGQEKQSASATVAPADIPLENPTSGS